MHSVTREEFLALAGVRGEYRPYTPVSIGRNNSVIRNNDHTFSTHMHRLEFLDSGELRKLRPPVFQRKPLYYTDDDGNSVLMTGYRGIVRKDGSCHTVVSDKYKMVQHRVMIDAMADAADDCGVRIFGRTFSNGGRFDGYAWFSNPDYHVFLDGERYDPMILGFRFHNSCSGDRVLGGEMVGIRHVCGNVGVYGDILGNVSYRHFKGVDYISEQISRVLRNFIRRKEVLEHSIHDMNAETLDADEQESVLWGLRLDPTTIGRVMSNRPGLNPAIRDIRKVNAFDLYNATTAYISYRSGGDTQILTNNELSSKISKIFSSNISELIEKGRVEREIYYSEEQKQPEIVMVV